MNWIDSALRYEILNKNRDVAWGSKDGAAQSLAAFVAAHVEMNCRERAGYFLAAAMEMGLSRDQARYGLSRFHCVLPDRLDWLEHRLTEDDGRIVTLGPQPG